jgi:alkylhydroperoxidase family enzyme
LQGEDKAVVEAIWRGDLENAPLSPAERGLLRFVELITKHAYRNTPEEVEKLRVAGWTDPQIAEAVYITALFAFFNRVADAFGLQDPGYFAAENRPQEAPPSEETEQA